LDLTQEIPLIAWRCSTKSQDLDPFICTPHFVSSEDRGSTVFSPSLGKSVGRPFFLECPVLSNSLFLFWPPSSFGPVSLSIVSSLILCGVGSTQAPHFFFLELCTKPGATSALAVTLPFCVECHVISSSHSLYAEPPHRSDQP